MKRYPPAVDTAITALLAQGIPAADIIERLAAGTAAEGLPPVAMPRRSFFAHRSRILAENPDLAHNITPDNEADRAAALERRLLHLCEQEAEKLARLIGRREPLSPSHNASLSRLTKTAADLAARAKRRAELASSPSSAERGSAAAASSPRASLLDRLDRAEREHVDPAPADLPNPQGGEGTPLVPSRVPESRD